MTAYATLPSYPGYGIYQDGVIRRLRDDKEMLPHNVVTLWVRGRAVTVDPEWLRALAWGDDSATDASAPAPAVEAPLLSDTAPDAAGDAGEWRPVPDMQRVSRSRASTGKKEWAACVQDKALLKGGQRRCATCGKATTNYRCYACWRSLRGFGAAQDDGMEI